jgi:hypothetical protein
MFNSHYIKHIFLRFEDSKREHKPFLTLYISKKIAVQIKMYSGCPGVKPVSVRSNTNEQRLKLETNTLSNGKHFWTSAFQT